MQAMTAGVTRANTGIDGIVWNILGQTYVPKQVSEASFSWHATFPPGTFAEISSLRPDVYTVVAWAFDANGQALQYGCTEMPVTIENGVRTEITLGLGDYDAP